MEYLVQQTSEFMTWHRRLRDVRARVAIARRIERATLGNLGDVKSVGGSVSELRVAAGKGYRMYFTMRQSVVIVLLCGGDKRHQQADIRRAQKLAEEVRV